MLNLVPFEHAILSILRNFIQRDDDQCSVAVVAGTHQRQQQRVHHNGLLQQQLILQFGAVLVQSVCVCVMCESSFTQLCLVHSHHSAQCLSQQQKSAAIRFKAQINQVYLTCPLTKQLVSILEHEM